MQKRIAVILAADVVGYARLMSENEADTYRTLCAIRDQAVLPLIEAHEGRVIKLMGDGILAEFTSVTSSVRAAREIQSLVAAETEEMPPERRIVFRIGINLGDVICEADDVYGHGVNVAARIESLARPGGISISRPVHDVLRDRMREHRDLGLEDAGEVKVKSIARPIRVYHLVEQGRPGVAAPVRGAVPVAPDGRVALLAAALALAFIWPGAAIAPGPVPVPLPPERPLPAIAMTTFSRDMFGVRERAAETRAPRLEQAAYDGLEDGIAAEPELTGAAAFFTSGRDAGTGTARDGDLTDTLDEGLAALAPVLPDPDPEPVPEPESAGTVDVRISFDFGAGAWSDCLSFGGGRIHSLPLDPAAGWVPVRLQNGPANIRLRARARARGAGMVVALLPYAGAWRDSDAIEVRIASRAPGSRGHGYSVLKSRPPLSGCGRFVAYVSLAG